MKKIVILFLALATVLSLTGCGNEVEDKKWSASAEETANRLGMEYEAFFCNGSDEQWMETVEQCAGEGYDGLLLSHGGEEYSYGFLTGLMEQYPNLKIATFDTFFEDDEGNSVKIDGVTQFFQQDSRMAEDLLDYICKYGWGRTTWLHSTGVKPVTHDTRKKALSIRWKP